MRFNCCDFTCIRMFLQRNVIYLSSSLAITSAKICTAARPVQWDLTVSNSSLDALGPTQYHLLKPPLRDCWSYLIGHPQKAFSYSIVLGGEKSSATLGWHFNFLCHLLTDRDVNCWKSSENTFFHKCSWFPLSYVH